MERIEDEALLGELKRRLEENKIAVNGLRALTVKLETVNEKLRQSESLRSNFLSNIRNEIINPLTSIMGLARQIVDKRADAAAAHELARMIYAESFDLDFQLRNIFTAAELEAGEAELGAARVDMAALVQGQVAAFSHKASEKRISLSLACDCCAADGSCTFTTDPDKYQKIIANLLANAIEFNREGKGVFLRLWTEGRVLHLSITDEGIGIPEADRRKVFDRFVQLDTGATKRHRGHGLGLSITKALAELLGGSVALAATKDEGCVFTVAVPELVTEQPVDATSGSGNEIIFGDGARY